jgi:hypothetical protein
VAGRILQADPDMTPRILLAGLGLCAAVAGCIAPPTCHELSCSAAEGTGSAPDPDPVTGFREVEPWGRESLGAERVNRSWPSPQVAPTEPSRAVARGTPVPTGALDLGRGATSLPSLRAEPSPPMPEAEPGSAALVAELLRRRQELEAARRTLAEQSRTAVEQRARADALQVELEQARVEGHALAARLVQAQIRRLEAEKLLLEHRLQSERVREVPAAREGPDGQRARVPGS